MVYTYEYDTSYVGPALPVVDVTIAGLGREHDSMRLRALVDSGADATMIPLRDLHHVGARKVDERRMRGVGGLSYLVDIYEITMHLGSYLVPKVYVIADRQNRETILGRDVLNEIAVMLNGPANVVEIHHS